MATTKINISGVVNSGSSIDLARSKVASAKSNVSSIRWQIDGKIKSRSNIESRLNSVSQSIGNIESRLGSIKNVVQNGAINYQNTDNSVTNQGKNLCGKVIPVGKSNANFFVSTTDRKNKEHEKAKEKDAIFSYLKNILKDAGHLGSILGFVSGLGKIGIQQSVGAVFAQGAKVGFSAIKDLISFEKDIKNLGKVKQMLHPDTLKVSWAKRIFGWTDAMKGTSSHASSFGMKFYNNFQKAGDRILESYNFTKNAGKATVAWAGVALSGVINFFDNQKEMKTNGISQGRAIAETITETAFDTVKSIAIGAAVTAGVAAAFGSAPVLVVAAGTVAVSMGLDALSNAIIGKNFTEAVSDGILDAGNAIGNALQKGFNSITNCFSNATKNIGAGWKLNFEF